MTETRSLLASLVPLFISLGGAVLANGLLGSMTPLAMEEQHYTLSQIGLVGAGYPIGMVLGAQICPLMVGRVGQIRVFAAFGAMAAVGTLLMPLLPTLWAWMLARVLLGFCMTGLFTIGEAWMNAVATPQTRGRILSVYMAVFYASAMGSQMLLGIVGNDAFTPFVLIALTFCVSLVPLTLGKIDNPIVPQATTAFSLRKMLRKTVTGSAGSFTTGLIMGSYGAFGAIFAKEVGGTVTYVAWFLMAGMAGALFLQPVVGRLSDTYDRRWVLVGVIGSIAVMALGFVLFGLAAPPKVMILVNAVFIGVTTCLYSVSIALAQDQLDPEEVVPASAALLMMNGLGNVFGPILATPVVGEVGSSGYLIFSAVVGVLATVVFIIRALRERAPAEEDDKVDFTVIAPTTPLLAELDPRSEPEEVQLEFDFWGEGLETPDPVSMEDMQSVEIEEPDIDRAA
ncbi:MAG: MFS transporter [Alphaproteobacteria bacterium]